MTSPGTEGVVGKSRALYSKENATLEKDAVSPLIYGVQWDATVRYLEKNYPDISKNSNKYGNYSGSTFTYIDLTGNTVEKAVGEYTLIPTGSTEYTKTNNIYDLCGNVPEWTMESFLGTYRVYRSGGYLGADNNREVSARRYQRADYSTYYRSFRLALYIK